MSVSFAHPWLAWGALLALLPILIHLLQRRRPRPHPFAALELVLRSQRENVRRIRLKRLLLLLARTALLLFVPLAIARPQFAAPAAASATAEGPAAIAIVLDASLSMRWGGGSVFENARKDARRVLADRLAEEPVTVVVCDGRPREIEPPSFDRGRARRTIDEAEAGYLEADLTACVQAAAQALAESPLPAKRIFVATDLAASGWRLDAPPPTVRTEEGEVQPEVVVLDAARGEAMPNLAITELRVEPAPELGARGRAITFTVQNFGDEEVRDRVAELFVGEELVAKTFVDVPAGGAATKRLLHRFPTGGIYVGAVRLSPDALPEDDERTFVAHVPRDLRVLVANGAPSPVRYRDEAFFVETALRSGGASPIEARTVDADHLARQPLDPFDALLLLNVRAPDRALAERIADFVRGGGGLFFALGDQVDADAYNEVFGDLLPLPLHVPKTVGKEGSEEGGALFSTFDFDHPILGIFSGPALEGLSTVRTRRYFLLRPGEGARVLATFDDGAPALVEKEIGSGRVMLFASTVDRDWSDWAIQPSFLPAMRQMTSYLARTLDERRAASVVLGERVDLAWSDEAPPTAILDPEGRELEHAVAEGGVQLVAERPGIHRARVGDGATQPFFTAHVSPRESDTRRLERSELQALLGGAKAQVAEAPTDGRRKSAPLWSLLLAVGLLTFFAEGLLQRK